MIDKCNFTSLFGETWQFNTTTCPLKEYEVEYDVRSEDEHERLAEHGIWPTHTYMGKCLIHLTGDVLRDTTEEYVTAVMSMKRIMLPKDEKQIQRLLGQLTLRYTGMAEDMRADVTLDGAPRFPKLANYPTVGEYFVTFKAANPYFVGVGSGAKYLV